MVTYLDYNEYWLTHSSEDQIFDGSLLGAFIVYASWQLVEAVSLKYRS